MYHPSMLLASNFNAIHAVLIATIAVLLIFSAFFSASETAFNSMNVIRVRTMAENKVKGARKALYISEHVSRALTTILVGNNIVNILATTLCAFVLSQLVSNATLMNILNTLVMTIIILIVGEILPKALAKSNPEKAACKLAGMNYALIKILYPIVVGFYGIQKLFTKKSEEENNNVTVTEDELETIIDTMEEEGVLQEDEASVLQGTFKLKEATAHDIMTHRVDVVFLSIDASQSEIEKTFVKHQYSRIPVFEDNTDNIVGVLNIKDFFNAKLENQKIDLRKLMTKPLFTAETTNVDMLVKKMQKEKKHLAVVLDEAGGVSGIVTLEDCMETIFGEIYDETDQDEVAPAIVKTDENEYDLDAEITIEELFDELEIEHMPENPYQSLNSFLFELSEEIPSLNKVLEFFTIDEVIDEEGNLTKKNINMKFKITKLDGHRIEKVHLSVIYLGDAEEANGETNA